MVLIGVQPADRNDPLIPLALISRSDKIRIQGVGQDDRSPLYLLIKEILRPFRLQHDTGGVRKQQIGKPPHQSARIFLLRLAHHRHHWSGLRKHCSNNCHEIIFPDTGQYQIGLFLLPDPMQFTNAIDKIQNSTVI